MHTDTLHLIYHFSINFPEALTWDKQPRAMLFRAFYEEHKKAIPDADYTEALNIILDIHGVILQDCD